MRRHSPWTATVLLVTVLAQLVANTGYAFDLGVAQGALGSKDGGSGASEFIYRNDADEALISVYLLGAVVKPGLYHIPSNTDLVSLLTLAGGPIPGAQTDKILIKGQGANESKRQVRFDLDHVVESDSPTKVGLVSNDLVYVTPGKPPVTGEVVAIVGMVSGVIGLILSGFLLKQTLSK